MLRTFRMQFPVVRRALGCTALLQLIKSSQPRPTSSPLIFRQVDSPCASVYLQNINRVIGNPGFAPLRTNSGTEPKQELRTRDTRFWDAGALVSSSGPRGRAGGWARDRPSSQCLRSHTSNGSCKSLNSRLHLDYSIERPSVAAAPIHLAKPFSKPFIFLSRRVCQFN